MPRRSRHPRWTNHVAALALGVTLLTARAAHAQALLERFDPAERGSRFFVADSLELEGNLRLSTGVVTSYGNRLRTFRASGADPEASDLVVHAAWIHPGASLVVAPGARFALDVPVALQSGTDVALDRTFFGRPASPRLGDVRASFDVRVAGTTRPDVDGALLAVGLSAYLPTGSASDYTGDDIARFDLRVANVVRFGHYVLASRVGYMYRRNELPSFGGVSLGSEANAVVAFGYRAGGLTVGPELFGSTILKDVFQRRSTPIEALLGAHVALGDLRVGAGVGTLLVSGLGAPKLRGVVSFEWVPGGAVARDRDHDGVVDVDDMCPDVPGLASADRGSRGCPAAPHDADHDGIFDTDDACPDLAGIRTRDPMTHGCPDADRDGIPDPIDACPRVAGERSVLPRFNGCPADADGDGVLDLQDACPDDPGIPTGDEATNGCPIPAALRDRDDDGVPDGADGCPEEKGVPSPDETLNGCPMVRLVGDLLVVARPLQLTTATGQRPVVFTPDSEQVLADIANFLVAHPEITRVRVSARGDAGERLKKPRAAHDEAQAAVERLVVYGVSRRRLEVRGIVDPAKNRRFELRVPAAAAAR